MTESKVGSCTLLDYMTHNTAPSDLYRLTSLDSIPQIMAMTALIIVLLVKL